MINFKKILQRAAAEPGRSSGVATLMMGVAHAGAAEAAPTAAGPAVSDLLEAPPAREGAPSTDTSGEGLVTDDLVRSALEAMFPDAAGTEGEATKPAAGADGHGEGDDSAAVVAALEGQTADAPAALAPAALGPTALTPEDSEKAIDDMLKDAFAAATAEDSASAGGEPQVAETPAASEPDAESVSEAIDEESAGQIDDSFMAEIDRLLNEFGQMGGETPAEQDAEEVAVNDLSMEALDALETSKALEMPEDEAPSPEDLSPDVPEAGSADGQSEPAEPAAEAEETAAPLESAAPAGKAAAAPAAEAKSQKPAEPAQPETLTQEEKDALFAETAEGETASDRPEEAAEPETAGQTGEPPQEADAAETAGPPELEFDFTPDGVGIAEPAESTTASVDTEDLLSKVLSDLDRLGDVDKPTKDAQSEEDEKEKDETEDFTQILTELDTEEQSPAEGDPAATDSPQAVEVAPASQSEEDLISDALNAADEVEAEIVTDEVPAKSKAAKDDDKKGAKKDKDAAKDKKADGAKAGKDKAGGGTAQSKDEEAEGEAAAQEPPAVENEASLLANLEASMAAASTDEEEDGKGDDSEEATEKKSQDDEDAVRKEVLSRTKEVEQKVLDDAFGGNTKEFRAEMKSEMAQAGKDVKKPGDKKSALASESARHAAGGPKAAAASPDTPKIEPAAQATLTFSPKDLDWFLWVAYQLNRPFLRWLNPERRALVGSLSIALILAAVIWAVVAFMMFWIHV
jgi:hypothetical protein